MRREKRRSGLNRETEKERGEGEDKGKEQIKA